MLRTPTATTFRYIFILLHVCVCSHLIFVYKCNFAVVRIKFTNRIEIEKSERGNIFSRHWRLDLSETKSVHLRYYMMQLLAGHEQSTGNFYCSMILRHTMIMIKESFLPSSKQMDLEFSMLIFQGPSCL